MSAVLFPTPFPPLDQVNPALITAALNALAADGPDVDLEVGGREPMVDQWEAGRRIPTREQLDALAAMTYLPVGLFFLPADTSAHDSGPTSPADAGRWRSQQLNQHDAQQLAERLTWLMRSCPSRGKPPWTTATLAAELGADPAAVDQLTAGGPFQLSEQLLANICAYFVVRPRFFDDPGLNLNDDTAHRITAGQLVLETIANQATVRTCRGTGRPQWRRGETPAQTIARLQPGAETIRALRQVITETEAQLAADAAGPAIPNPTTTTAVLAAPAPAESTPAPPSQRRRWWQRRP